MTIRNETRRVHVLRDLGGATTLVDPERRKLVDALREEPDSASGLARRLGDSRQRLNYHLRALEKAGILEVGEERRRGNCIERVLRVVAERFVIDPTAIDAPAPSLEAGDRFSSSYLVALAARAIDEVAALRDKAADEEKRLATASIDARVSLDSPDAMRAFVQDLTEAVAGVVARHHAPGGSSRTFRVTTLTHPEVRAKAPDRPTDEERSDDD